MFKASTKNLVGPKSVGEYTLLPVLVSPPLPFLISPLGITSDIFSSPDRFRYKWIYNFLTGPQLLKIS